MVIKAFENSDLKRQHVLWKRMLCRLPNSWMCDIKNISDIQSQNMAFPIKCLLREYRSSALWSFSATTSQIMKNLINLCWPFHGEFYSESRFSDWHSYWTSWRRAVLCHVTPEASQSCFSTLELQLHTRWPLATYGELRDILKFLELKKWHISAILPSFNLLIQPRHIKSGCIGMR